ncbi:steroid receptor-associated and regulated protein isoform X2 [Fukomys damarensis]|uniref:steroid receptor-associated and regulated protein isoform X2 n=1 Tax=Fukomys damarensis TaxID=885580 RepID=UPI0014558C27|nr:steroid receptor-associated and regulated protein isoform X2 [Fukomys damarensis]
MMVLCGKFTVTNTRETEPAPMNNLVSDPKLLDSAESQQPTASASPAAGMTASQNAGIQACSTAPSYLQFFWTKPQKLMRQAANERALRQCDLAEFGKVEEARKPLAREYSAGGKPAHPPAIPTAHVTFIIDCARGKQLSLAAPPLVPQAPSPGQGPITPSVKTYIVFCGGNWALATQGTLLDGQNFAQAKDTPKPCSRAEAPASCPASPSRPQGAPKAKENPWKGGPSTSSSWGAIKGSLKALSSCICGQAS